MAVVANAPMTNIATPTNTRRRLRIVAPRPDETAPRATPTVQTVRRAARKRKVHAATFRDRPRRGRRRRGRVRRCPPRPGEVWAEIPRLRAAGPDLLSGAPAPRRSRLGVVRCGEPKRRDT